MRAGMGIAGAAALVVGVLAGAFLGVSGGALGGCDSLLSLDEYEITPAGDASCFSGAATTNAQIVNACTEGACTPFDNAARIAGFDAQNPPLPQTEPSADTDAGGDAPIADAAPDGTPSGNPKCADLAPRPVYLHGSSALALALKTFAQAIGDEATLVYARDASCNGLDAVLTGNTRSVGTGQYWKRDSDATFECDYPPAPEGQVVDVGLCDIFATTCNPDLVGLPDSVGDFTGAVQVFMFTVPETSTQKAISAEAAYRVYGLGSASGVAPWDDEQFIFKRFEKSGNQQTISAFIGVPVDRWKGQSVVSSADMKPRLLASTDPEKTIGITSGDVADDIDTRRSLRTLAYQHYGQSCAFTPDSDLGSYDKKNVRDGHYYMWAPVHFYARLEGGVVRDPIVRDVVNYLSGAKPLPSKNTDLIATLKSSGLVPRCAMRVSRVKEGGELSPFTPHPSCACAFEAASPSSGVSAQCKPCSDDSQCSADRPSCSFGFCEPS